MEGITRSYQEMVLPGRIKWNKLSAFDKYIKYQCILEPLIAIISADFNNSEKAPGDVDDTFPRLIDAIHTISNTLPHSRFKKNLKPFWNSELSLLKNKKVTSYNKWVSAGRPRASNSELFAEYKIDKKLFHSTLKRLSKEYENREILEAIKSAELNRNSFWKLVNTARKNPSHGISAIRRLDDVEVHEVNEVLDVWANHFLRIGSPKHDEKYDEGHFKIVTDFVKDRNEDIECDQFLEVPYTVDEIAKAIKTLHLGEAPGYDGIMSEHLLYAGPMLVNILYDLYNTICISEYIPPCFKLGVQVPLYKGKDTCVLDPNNYQGITLLPTFNKLFEILLWQRMTSWWNEEQIMSELHTGFNLRETIATSLESSRLCFVAFFDVAKAFNTVWIDGLFKQMYDLGITGKTWRLLYRGYIHFTCCFKLQAVSLSGTSPCVESIREAFYR